MQDAFIPLNSSPGTISPKVNQLLDSRTREEWMRNLSAASMGEKEKAERMWQEVIACIQAIRDFLLEMPGLVEFLIKRRFSSYSRHHEMLLHRHIDLAGSYQRSGNDKHKIC